MLENENINEPQNPAFLVGAVMCSVCEGTGTLTEPDCCWNVDYIQKYGSCCGNPNPIQVQCKYCQGEGFFKHCT